MADDFTTVHGFTKPEVGASQDSWGGKLNTNWDDVDALIPAIPFTSISVSPSGSNVEFLNLPAGIEHARMTVVFTQSDVFGANLFCQLGTLADDFIGSNYRFNMKEHLSPENDFVLSLSFRGTINENTSQVQHHAFWDLVLVDGSTNNRWHCHSGGTIQGPINSLTSGSGSIALNNVLDRIKLQASAGVLSIGQCTLQYS